MIHSVALVSGVYHDKDGPARLRRRLAAAREEGAGLAVLPELPLDRWIPSGRTPDDADAEPTGGRRHRVLANTAAAAGVTVLGGAIVREGAPERRFNTALLFGTDGGLLLRYRKVHIPSEEGFWEADHYVPGDEPPAPVAVDGLRLGVQICSDIQRPAGAQLLAAGGVEVILVPRATPPETWERWKLTLRAAAVAAAAYVISVNRPVEEGSPVGGPSLAIDPRGEVVLETTEEVAVVEVDREMVREARGEYPGYLSYAAGVMARGWGEVPG